VLFGGFATAECYPGFPCGYVSFNDVWELSLSGTATWQQLLPSGRSPPARYGNDVTYDRVGDQMFVVGGEQRFGRLSPPVPLNDTWSLHWNAPDSSPNLDVRHALDVGVAYVGWPHARTLDLWNIGLEPLDVSNITSPDPEIGASPASLSIAGVHSQAV